MSYIVKGKDIPQNCRECPLAKIRFPDGYYAPYAFICGLINKRCENPKLERIEDCPLVEIPPHGRLIDADALEEYCKRQVRDEWNQKAGASWSYAFAEFENIVDDCDTIIEAEGVKE